MNKVTEMVWDDEDTWSSDDLDIFNTFHIDIGVPKAAFIVNEQDIVINPTISVESQQIVRDDHS